MYTYRASFSQEPRSKQNLLLCYNRLYYIVLCELLGRNIQYFGIRLVQVWYTFSDTLPYRTVTGFLGITTIYHSLLIFLCENKMNDGPLRRASAFTFVPCSFSNRYHQPQQSPISPLVATARLNQSRAFSTRPSAQKSRATVQIT